MRRNLQQKASEQRRPPCARHPRLGKLSRTTKGAFVITYTILGAPYYICPYTTPRTTSQGLIVAFQGLSSLAALDLAAAVPPIAIHHGLRTTIPSWTYGSSADADQSSCSLSLASLPLLHGAVLPGFAGLGIFLSCASDCKPLRGAQAGPLRGVGLEFRV